MRIKLSRLRLRWLQIRKLYDPVSMRKAESVAGCVASKKAKFFGFYPTCPPFTTQPVDPKTDLDVLKKRPWFDPRILALRYAAEAVWSGLINRVSEWEHPRRGDADECHGDQGECLLLLRDWPGACFVAAWMLSNVRKSHCSSLPSGRCDHSAGLWINTAGHDHDLCVGRKVAGTAIFCVCLCLWPTSSQDAVNLSSTPILLLASSG